MKEDELRKYAVCEICGKKVGAAALPMFFTVEVTPVVFNHEALQRQTGLEMQFNNNVALAQVFSTGEDLAKEGESAKVSVCYDCSDKQIRVVDIINSDEE